VDDHHYHISRRFKFPCHVFNHTVSIASVSHPSIYLRSTMPAYPDNVLSVHEKFPDLPAILGTIDLNRRIGAGSPLDPQHLKHAQDTAIALRGLNSEYIFLSYCVLISLFTDVRQIPQLNEEVVRSADLHAKAIEGIRKHVCLPFFRKITHTFIRCNPGICTS
jgi:hypothetical protein